MGDVSDLIERMEGPIRTLARRYAENYKDGDFDDLCQIGRIAVNTIGTGGANNFNPKRATSSFHAFVAYRIKLAILDALRFNTGGIIRVPRQLTSRYREDAKRAAYVQVMCDSSDRSRLNQLKGTYKGDMGFERALEPIDAKYDLDDIIRRRENIAIVHQIIDAMPPNWAEVMRRRLKGEEFKEIGEAIGCTTSNAFQLSKKAHKWFAILVRESYSPDIIYS